MSRPNWQNYFMSLAHQVATRGTCNRKKVGCVIVDSEHSILATGYNGSPPGMPHCDDVDHDMLNGNCVRTTHSELNAIAQAARRGVSLRGASIFINTFPCWNCMKMIATAGIRRVYFDDEYRRDERVDACAKMMGIEIIGPSAWKAAPPL